MPCLKLGTDQCPIIICTANIFKYPYNGKDYYFQLSKHGWAPLRKDNLEPRVTYPSDWEDMMKEFLVLSKEEKEKYLI